MTRRFGLGPVFANEWLTNSRRWQSYAGRSGFVVVLLVGLAGIWVGRTAGQSLPAIQAMADIGRGFYTTIVVTQLTLVLLAAPAATAGAICQDKASGVLAQMLLTDLSDAEIVAGKLAARLVPVIGLVCCALPVLAIATLLGGIDPQALAGVFLITVSVAIFGCTLAFTLSIWGSRPYEVLLSTYAFFAVWMLAVPVVHLLNRLWRLAPLPRWTITTNPYTLALAPYEQPGGQYGPVDDVALSAALVLISAVMVVFAIVRMRSVIVRQADAPASPRRSTCLPGARLGGRWFKVARPFARRQSGAVVRDAPATTQSVDSQLGPTVFSVRDFFHPDCDRGHLLAGPVEPGMVPGLCCRVSGGDGTAFLAACRDHGPG